MVCIEESPSSFRHIDTTLLYLSLLKSTTENTTLHKVNIFHDIPLFVFSRFFKGLLQKKAFSLLFVRNN